MRRLAPVLVLLIAGPARAHEAGLSRGDYHVVGARVDAELVFARKELAGLIADADTDRDGRLGEFELLAIDAPLRAQLVDGLQVRAGALACPGAVTRLVFVEEDGLMFAARFTCPLAPGAALTAVTLRWPLLARLGAAHRHVGALDFATGPEGQVTIPVDFVASARRGALTIRRPGDAPTRDRASPSVSAPASPAPPAAPPASSRWPVLAPLVGLALLALAWLVLRARAGRR